MKYLILTQHCAFAMDEYYSDLYMQELDPPLSHCHPFHSSKNSRTTDLYHRTDILLSRPYSVVGQAKYANRRRDNNTVIHILSCHRVFRRPEGEDEDCDHIQTGKSIVHYTEYARNMPWAPDPFCAGCIDDQIVSTIGTLRRKDTSTCTTPEKKDRGDQIGKIEAGYRE